MRHTQQYNKTQAHNPQNRIFWIIDLQQHPHLLCHNVLNYIFILKRGGGGTTQCEYTGRPRITGANVLLYCYNNTLATSYSG